MVIVLSVRGCGIGGLGPYGNEWIATPHLDRFAAEGEVYDRHFSSCPDPLATRRVWWSMIPAGSVLIRHTRPVHDAPAELTTPFAAVIDARSAELPRLDDVLAVLPDVLDRKPDLIWIDTDRLIPPWPVQQDVFEVYLEELTEDLEPQENEEPVSPWADPPTGEFDRDDLAAWELLHRTYAATLTTFDAEFGRLLALLRERGLADSTTIAFTADFGFPLGQHGLIGPHRPYLHEEFVHLPLMVRRPGATTAGMRFATFTQTEDVLPILLGQGIPKRTAIVSHWKTADAEEAALRTDTHTFLLPLTVPEDEEPRSPMLFAMPDDRWEVNDIHQANLDLAEELEAELRGRITPPESSPESSPLP